MARASHVTVVPAGTEDELGKKLVTVNDDGTPTVKGAEDRHASNAVTDPAWRAHTWTVYVPAAGGVHVHVLEVLQPCGLLQLAPSNKKN